MKAPRYDYSLTVDPNYFGEYLDALGIKRALEEEGMRVKLNEIPVTKIIKHPVAVPEGVFRNINFHSSYHTCPDAIENHLFFHEIHDIDFENPMDDKKLPLGIFNMYDGVFTPASGFAKAVGIDHLQMAADPYLYRPVKLDKLEKERFGCDVVFIGNNHQHRMKDPVMDYIQPLIDAGKTVHIYGNGWEQFFGPDVVKGMLPWTWAKKVYSAAKVGLNFVVGGMEKWGLGTNRLYQMGACGLPSVSYKCDDYVDAYGDDQKYVHWASGADEFVSKTLDLLKDNKKRQALGERFYKHTINNHLWKHRTDDMQCNNALPNKLFRDYPLQPHHHQYSTDLFIGIPGEHPKDYFATGLMSAITMDRPRFYFEVWMPQRNYSIEVARNMICSAFLQSKAPILFMIDNDLRLDPRSIEAMLASMVRYDIDILSGWYHKWDANKKVAHPHFTIDPGDGSEIYPHSFSDANPIPAVKVPGGMLMIQRRVIEKFYNEKKRWFIDTRHSPPNTPHGGLSEDYFFCSVARELGFKIYVEPKAFATHLKHSIWEKDDIQIF